MSEDDRRNCPLVCVVLFASWRSRSSVLVTRDGPVPMVLCAEWAFLFEALVLGRFPNDRPSLMASIFPVTLLVAASDLFE